MIQGAEKILTKLRDSVPKEEWTPVLNQLLIQEPFEVRINNVERFLLGHRESHHLSSTLYHCI